MKKGIIIAIGIVLIVGIAGGAYWWGTQQKTAPKVSPTLTTSPIPVPTKMATPMPLLQKGTIEGSMSFPGEGIPDYIEVCAENQSTKEVLCTTERINNSKYTYGIGYMLAVPAGGYYVYALDPNRNYKAYYSEFVTCGLSIDCPSHDLILVEVKAGEMVSEVDPQDWYK
jgi:hypothetical protein